MTDDCSQNVDPLKLVREGTSQDGRASDALDPANAPTYARSLKYFDVTNTAAGDWSAFFGGDVSVPLAVAAIEDVETYKTNTRSWFNFLNDLANQSKDSELRDRLGYLYASIGTLALALDGLRQVLPPEIPLGGTVQGVIKTQLAPAFGRLIAYYKGGDVLGVVNPVVPSPPAQILRQPVVTFADVLSGSL